MTLLKKPVFLVLGLYLLAWSAPVLASGSFLPPPPPPSKPLDCAGADKDKDECKKK